MPPYASHQQHDDYVQVLNGSNYDAFVGIPLDDSKRNPIERKAPLRAYSSSAESSAAVPPPPPLHEADHQQRKNNSSNNNNSKRASVFSRMLDFNLCTAVKLPNPSSALFKERVCTECGCNVYKYHGGYEKEIVPSAFTIATAKPEPDLLLDLFDLDVHEDNIDEDDVDADIDSDLDSCDRSVYSAVSETFGETKIYYHKECHTTHRDRIAHRENGFAVVLIDLLDHFEAEARQARLQELEARQLARELEEARALLEQEEAAARREALCREERKFKNRAKTAIRKAKKSLSLKSKKNATESESEPAAAHSKQPRTVQLSWGENNEEKFVGDDSSGNDDEAAAAAATPTPLQTPKETKQSFGRRAKVFLLSSTKEPAPQMEQFRPVQLSWGSREENIQRGIGQ